MTTVKTSKNSNSNNNNNNNNNNNINQKNKNHKNSENQKPSGRSSMNRTTQQQYHHPTQNLNNNSNSSSRGHRHDLIRDKENSNSIFSEMEYQNLSKISVQFQNYVKDIINKYYSETPLLFPSPPSQPLPPQHNVTTSSRQFHQHQQHQMNLHDQRQQTNHHHQSSSKRQKILSETEEYIEYLKNKEDITLTITPKVKTNNSQAAVKQPNCIKSTINNNNNNNNNSRLYKDQTPVVVIKRQSPQKSQNTRLSIETNKLPPTRTALPIATPIPLQPTQPPLTPLPPQTTCFQENTKKKISNLESLLPLLVSAAAAIEAGTHTVNVNAEPLDFSQNKNSLNNNNFNNGNRNRKQAQPKKIKTPPEIVVALLRDKYLNRMVDRKKSCTICTNSAKKSMLVFPYHTAGSLALHRLWKHTERTKRCHHCDEKVKKTYSLKVHYRRKHAVSRNDFNRAGG